MKPAKQLKPISEFKANAAEILRDLKKDQRPMVITQSGKAQAVLQDVTSYEAMQETIALLKILDLGQRQIDQGDVISATDARDLVRARRKNLLSRCLRSESR